MSANLEPWRWWSSGLVLVPLGAWTAYDAVLGNHASPAGLPGGLALFVAGGLAIWRAVWLRRNLRACPCCGQPCLPDARTIDDCR